MTAQFDTVSPNRKTARMLPTTPVTDWPGSRAASALATSLTAALATRAEELARAWLERVRSRLEHRPHAGFPGPTLLEQAPLLVGWSVRGWPFDDPDKTERWARVRVDRDRDRLGWRVQVSDNGLGIPRAEQERVFRRFYRTAGGGHGDLACGTGLGLVIAREAAEQPGSELALESVPGVGTTLVFTVPDPEHP